MRFFWKYFLHATSEEKSFEEVCMCNLKSLENPSSTRKQALFSMKTRDDRIRLSLPRVNYKYGLSENPHTYKA